MVNILVLFVALFSSTLTLMLSVGMLGSLLGLRMSLEGFSHLEIGVVLSGFYLGLVIGSFLYPPVVRRVGHIRAFSVFADEHQKQLGSGRLQLWSDSPSA